MNVLSGVKDMAKINLDPSNPDHIAVDTLAPVIVNPFARADASQSHIRIVLTGPSGSGKSYTALMLATELSKKRIAVIDTENDSAALYANQFTFDALNLLRFTPRYYVQMIEAAAQNNYDVCIVDSLTHSWNGRGGILEIAGGNIRGWKDATPQYQALIDCLIRYRRQMHIICTLRSKMAYNLSSETGSLVVTKVGLEPIHRSELPYEFDCVIDLSQQHVITVSKSRYAGLDGLVLPAGKESITHLAQLLTQWKTELSQEDLFAPSNPNEWKRDKDGRLHRIIKDNALEATEKEARSRIEED